MRKYELMSPNIEGVVTLQRSRLFDLLAPYEVIEFSELIAI